MKTYLTAGNILTAKKQILVMCFLLSALIAKSQTDPKILPNILLPSPEAAALGKYNDIPIGYETGVPNISVPFYEISTPRFKIPISLSYHAGGFKVEEVAGNAGLGFTLVANGSISRVIKGTVDEGGYGVLENGFTLKADALSKTCGWYGAMQSCPPQADAESDDYSFNAPGLSGKFIYDNLKNPMINPLADLSIALTPVVNVKYPSGYYRIIDESGNIFLFGELETTNSGCQDYISAWHLTEMISADQRDTVLFTYTQQGNYSNTTEVKTVIFGNNETGNPVGSDIQCQMSYDEITPISTSSVTSYYPKLLSRITYKNGKAEFRYALDRQDLESGVGPRLIAVSVYRQLTATTYTKLKSMGLNQDYFVSGSITDPDPYTRRLKLNSVTEFDADSTVVKTTSFDYNAVNPLPSRKSYARDMWGFYNGQTSNGSLVRTVYQAGFYGLYQIGNANREPYGAFIGGNLITKIHYQTGGTTEFHFEPNRTMYQGLPNSSSYTQAEANASGEGTIHSQISGYYAATGGYGYLLVGVGKFGSNPNTSKVIITDSTSAGVNTLGTYTGTSTADFNLKKSIAFSQGHHYRIHAMAYTYTTQHAGGSFSVVSSSAPAAAVTAAGGMRIKTIKNFDENGKLAEFDSLGYIDGTLLIPVNLLTMYYRYEQYMKNYGSQHTIGQVSNISRLVFSGGNIIEFGTYGGSTVLYPKVSKYKISVSDFSKLDGSSDFYYSVFPDSLYQWGLSNSNYLYTTQPTLPGYSSEDATIQAIALSRTAYTNQRYTTISNDWKNGNLTHEVHFKYINSNSFKVKEVVYNFDYSNKQRALALKTGYKIQGANCQYQADVDTYFWYGQYPIYSGKSLLVSQTTTDFASNNTAAALATTTSFRYSPVNFLPLKTATLNSRGDSIITKHLYTSDTVFSGIPETTRQNMLTRHMHNTLLKEDLLSNNSILHKKFYSYSLQQNGFPALNYLQIRNGNGPLETRLQYLQYDARLNPAELSMSDDVHKCYLWGYNGAYPIAEVTGASIGTEIPASTTIKTAFLTVNNLAVTSNAAVQIGTLTTNYNESSVEVNFGIANTGTAGNVKLIFRDIYSNDIVLNMPAPGGSVSTVSLAPSTAYTIYYQSQCTNAVDIHINSISRIRSVAGMARQVFHTSFETDGTNTSATSKTGKVSHLGLYDLIQPQTNGSYIVTWWEKNGAAAWTYNERAFTVSSATTTVQTIGTSATSLVDEVRLYPQGAQMTTYTYNPGVGTLSSTDASSQSTTYEYDSFQRLIAVKDNLGKVLKTYSYKYRQ